MPYVTIQQLPIYYQITFDDILEGNVDVSKMTVPNITNTRTCYRETLNPKLVNQYNIPSIVTALSSFNSKYSPLFEKERQSLYDTFYIPKKSGGLRKIDAPIPELMTALRELKEIFETNMPACYHTSAFAYIKGRCTIDSVKRHQQNESKWFAKFDFSNFFGSTTEQFVMKMLSTIFPFSEIVKYPAGEAVLKKALNLSFLNAGLPQGTPISPLITNIMMIPIDFKICNDLRKMDEHFVYTRYADDILVSSKIKFDCGKIQDYIIGVLNSFGAPFILNKQKTRFGSAAGRNWNLGVMLNKDNNITIGYRKKKTFKAMCCNYICDKKNGIKWDKHDVQVFAGLISYYKMIEPDYIDYIIKHNNEKFSVDINSLIKDDLK